MANRAYLRVWTRDFNQETMIKEFARFLTTAPLSASRKGFDELVVQPVDATEQPLVDWDLRSQEMGPAEVAAMAVQHLNTDSAYFVKGQWDLWKFDVETMKWVNAPQPLLLVCQGTDYDDGVAATTGHFYADLEFEHAFTGHGGFLAPGAASNPFDASDHPVEKAFRSWMSNGANLKEYQEKTRENIRKLFGWVEAVEAALPVERSELWSEGEGNFEARLDAILAQK